MSKKKQSKHILPNDEIVNAIIQDLNHDVDKKQIANKYSVNIGVVYRICNRNQNKINIQKLVANEDEKSQLNVATVEEISSDVLKEKHMSDVASIEEETEVEVEEALNSTRKKRTNITPELKHNIIHDYYTEKEKNKTSQADIAMLYDVSQSSVQRVLRSYDDFLHASSKQLSGLLAIPLDKQYSQDLPFNKNLIKDLDDQNYVSIGLIAGRHDMGVSEYIYDKVDQDLLFDFDKQYELALKYLKNKIPFKNGKATKGVYLYTSGLQSALQSATKACLELDIPLTVMHYNAAEKAYIPQVITENKEIITSLPVELNNVIQKHERVRIYNCTPQDIVDHGDDLIEVVECYFDSPIGTTNRQIKYTECIIFINQDAAWEYFRIKAEEMVYEKSVFLNYSNIKDGKYFKLTNIARVSN